MYFLTFKSIENYIAIFNQKLIVMMSVAGFVSSQLNARSCYHLKYLNCDKQGFFSNIRLSIEMQQFIGGMILIMTVKCSLINTGIANSTFFFDYETINYNQSTENDVNRSAYFQEIYASASGSVHENSSKIGVFTQRIYKSVTITTNQTNHSPEPQKIIPQHEINWIQVNPERIFSQIRNLLFPNYYYTTTFTEFIAQYSKSYKTISEYYYRQSIFYKNLQKINAFNSDPDRLFNMGINQFTDIQENQFYSSYATLIPEPIITIENRFLQNTSLLMMPDFTISWKCYSGPVNNQGRCGSCYAFACADAVSSLYTLYDPQTPFYIRLSVQQLISCNKPVLKDGCQGGLFENTYDYIKQFGITTEFNYPYVSAFSLTPPACNEAKTKSLNKRKISSYARIAPSCKSVLQELKNQPMAVGISSRTKFQFYREGVYSQSPTTITDHAVLLIGYDSLKGFQIKNMWGRTWGLLGYGWVSYTMNAGICSRAMKIQMPENMPSQQNACFF